MKKNLLYLAFAAFTSAGLHAQINVSATGGTGAGTYTTLKGAFDAINAGTHQGAIAIDVTASTTETEAAVLNGNTSPASYTSVLIKPATGVTATISGSIATAIIKLNGADNVTINGSNNGSSSRNLTISNTLVATAGVNPAVLWVASTANDGANNVTLRNTNFAGSTPTGTVGGVLVSGSTLGAAEVSNNNFTAINNTFVRAQNGIFAIGNNTTTDTGWIIRNNEIGSTVAADKMLFRGMAVQNAKNFEVSGNIINGVVIGSTGTAQGMLIGVGATDGAVYNNVISDIKNTNADGYGAVGLYLNSNSTTANLLVYNNTISDVTGTGYALGGALGDNGNGIFVAQGAGYKIYYNTVVLNTNQTNGGRPSAINIASTVTAAGAIDLRNNIFVNTQTTTGQRYAIYSGAANTVFSNINNNDYYTTGANLGYIGATNRATLADIQTNFGGNTNSISVLPVFTSSTDFRIQAVAANAALDNKATPVADVTTDADGSTRNATTPDLGSYEFSAPLSAEEFVKSNLIFNNPVSDYLTIKNSMEIQQVEIFTLSGQMVNKADINSVEGAIDMRKVSSGIYVVNITSEGQTTSIKVVKK
jgi:hypothetical protein